MYVPYACTGSGSSYTPVAIATQMAGVGIDVRLYTTTVLGDVPRALNPVTGLAAPIPARLRKGRLGRVAKCIVERKLCASVRDAGPGTIVWLWPDATQACIDRLRDLGAFLIREMINTHRGTAKRILDAEAGRVAVSGLHAISDRSVDEEQHELLAVDAIVSPSTGVDASLEEWAIPAKKIVRSHFGWDSARCLPAIRCKRQGKVVALFVGQISMRKGAHLALAAWQGAEIDGVFRLVGDVAPEMREILNRHLSSDGVEHIPFTNEIARHYSEADFLFFPTLEEGAPLVCYEACSQGLPVLTTEMGAARIIVDNVSGLVVEPHDAAAVVHALQALSRDRKLRDRLSSGALSAAKVKTWRDAALSRIDQVGQILQNKGAQRGLVRA